MEKIATPGAKTIDELAALLNIEARETAKAVFMMGTFIDSTNGDEQSKLIVAIIRGDLDVEESKLSNAVKANAIRPAHDEEIRAEGIVPGYGSAINASKNIIVVVDDSVAKSNNLVAGANEEGYHFINTNFKRDYDGMVKDIASCKTGCTCSSCGGELNSSKGVEVGNIFQLGTRYSEAMNCYYQAEDGTRKPVIMGSYGIGLGRVLACLAEEFTDDIGLRLPISVAPYKVHFVSLIKDADIADGIYNDLKNAGVEVLYDNRKESAGVKFADADLIGAPIRITLGNRGLKENTVEVKYRASGEVTNFNMDEIVAKTKEALKAMQDALDAAIVEKELV